MARVPSFQVDRAVLDEEVLRRATEAGARLLRPAKVKSVKLAEGQKQEIEIESSTGVKQSIFARWVVDASGVAAVLARKNGWLPANAAHPTSAVWARWRGVEDLDGLRLAEKFPKWAKLVHGFRGTATNHFNGEGWWAWCIPLAGGDVSVGIVFDERLVRLGEGPTLGQRLKRFLLDHAVARELLENAEPIEGDTHLRRNLPYISTRIFGDGFACVGDAAGFLDPLYSPGMDWIAYTVCNAVELINLERSGMAVAEKAACAGERMSESYWRWFRAVYQDKYYYLGEYDLVKIGFLLDLGLYYAGVASQPFKRGKAALLEPVFSTKPSIPFYHFMAFYNRRLARIGKRRMEQGRASRLSANQRFLFPGYTFSPLSFAWILYALCGWLKAEVKELRHLFWSSPVPACAPVLQQEESAAK
jgi:flavin-dependent dehydrogenase